MNPSPVEPLVLLDATAISAQRGGVGRYVDELVRESVPAGIPLVVVCQERDHDTFSAMRADVIVAPTWIRSVPLRFVWEQIGLPAIAARVGATVIHSPHYTFPLVTSRRRVVTVHDLTFWSHPDRHSVLKRLFFRTWIRLSAAFRLDVIVPSAATGLEFERVTGAEPARISVAYHGVDSATFHSPSNADVDRFTAAHGVRSWVAFLGTIEPRKNVVPLIEGFRAAIATMSEPPSLLLAGAPGWDTEVGDAIAAATNAGVDVRHLGYVPIDELAALLGGALVVAYPSEGEGFGLPVLEAIACGAPVLTSRSLALPEVGGDAVEYSDTTSAAIGAALGALMRNPARRAEMQKAGMARATTFTWARCLEMHRLVWGVG
jgi:glycosyltransferase involved in cell wall biosynthesis